MHDRSIPEKASDSPPISVIVPSLNQGRYIERTIASVVEQDYSNKECIVIDGGSKDNTIEVLKSFGDSIRWISEPDRGQSHAVNKGVGLSGGEIIGWLNSDDTYVPGALTAISGYFSAHGNADIVYGNGNFIDEADRIIGPYPTKEYDYELFRHECYICQPALFLKRSIFDKHGGLDEAFRFAMDFEYWLRIGREENMVSIDTLLANYRLHDASITTQSRRDMYREVLPLLQREFGQVSMKWLESYAHFLVSGKMPGARLNRGQKILRKLLQRLLYLRYNHRRVLARLSNPK
jgi:glycosyltransferase involved in cell wall biosynthesis